MTGRSDLIDATITHAIATGDPLTKATQTLVSEWTADSTHKAAVRYHRDLRPGSKAETKFTSDLRAALIDRLASTDQARAVICRQSQPIITISEQLPLHWWGRLATAVLTRQASAIEAAAGVLYGYLEAGAEGDLPAPMVLAELARHPDQLRQQIAALLGDISYTDKNGQEIEAGQWVVFDDKGKTRLAKVAGLARSEAAFILEWWVETGRCYRDTIPAAETVYAEPAALTYVHTEFLSDRSGQSRAFLQYHRSGAIECRAHGCRFLRMKAGCIHTWFDSRGQQHFGFTTFEIIEPDEFKALLKQALTWAQAQAGDLPDWCLKAQIALAV